MDTIRFYGVGDEWGEFSNFAEYPVRLDGRTWPTTEHYFQAQKFLDAADREQVRRATSPGRAAALGRDRKKKLRRDWDSVRIDVMRKALRAKFTQHRVLAELLVATQDASLVEHTANDAFWGDGGGSGKNMLGRLLMELRDQLRDEIDAIRSRP